MHLTALQRQLCNLLQDGLPICARPFAQIARDLGSNEKEILQQLHRLKKSGIIRRIGAVINYHALGKTGTLVTAAIPEQMLEEVIETVNALDAVSHNYLRKHHYNLWFTLQADSYEKIRVELAKLSARFNIEFHSLPVVRTFKLNVRFDAQNREQILTRDVAEAPKTQAVELTDIQSHMLSKLQKPLDLAAEPFARFCEQGLETEEVLRIIKELSDKGVLRRIAAIVDHRKLGFVANILFAAKVAEDRIAQAGRKLSNFSIVSHCYQRKTVEKWPYNLYAMMHGKSFRQIQHVIDKFAETEMVESFELLPTESELKKQPVKHNFG